MPVGRKTKGKEEEKKQRQGRKGFILHDIQR